MDWIILEKRWHGIIFINISGIPISEKSSYVVFFHNLSSFVLKKSDTYNWEKYNI